MEQTDTLSVHAPLTLETRGMISRAVLERMPKGGVVVSTARGPICDVDALADLLKRGHLAGVGLDVLPVGAAGRAHPRALARLPCARAVVRGAPDHHPALGLLHARGLGRYQDQVGGNHARSDDRTAAAERHHAGDVLTA